MTYSRLCGVGTAECAAASCSCVSVGGGGNVREKPARAFAPRWRDKQGDVWHEEADGLMHSFETAPFPREYVERKWGPLVLVPDPINEAHNLSREDC